MSGSEKIVTNILIIYEFIEATNIELDRYILKKLSIHRTESTKPKKIG